MKQLFKKIDHESHIRDVCEDMANVTLDVIGYAGFGYDFHAVKDAGVNVCIIPFENSHRFGLAHDSQCAKHAQKLFHCFHCSNYKKILVWSK